METFLLFILQRWLQVLQGTDWRVTFTASLPYTPRLLAVECNDYGTFPGTIITLIVVDLERFIPDPATAF